MSWDGGSWGRRVAWAQFDAQKAHPNDPVAQRRYAEERLGILSAERLEDERDELRRTVERRKLNKDCWQQLWNSFIGFFARR